MIKLNREVFDRTAKSLGLSDQALAGRMGVSTTQLWRVRLPDDDPRHNDPGEDFIAGALKAFPQLGFDKLFFLA